MSNQNINSRISGSSRRDEVNYKSPQSSVYTQKQPQQKNEEGGYYPNTAYRSMKFPDQINFNQLVEKKQVLQQLQREFRDKNSRVVFEPYKSQEYSKRLMLLQKQIDGLMRQSYNYSGKNPGQRTIDYTVLINEKQNQINQLQRKISHLQSQLRMKDHRQNEMQKQLEKRFQVIKDKNDQIQRLKGSNRTYTENGKSPNQIVNSQARKLMSSIDNMLRQGNPTPNQLQRQIEGWIMGLPNESLLKRKLREADENWLQDKYKRYVSYITTQAASMVNNVHKLYTSQIINLKSNGAPVDYDPKIMNLIGKDVVPSQFLPTQDTIMRTQITNEVNSLPLMVSSQRQPYYNNVSRVSVQVPVQDTRTKAIIFRLANQMRRLYTKYPKLATQISPQLSEYLTKQVTDIIQVDQLDKLVEIVKYQPQVVRVQNVYNFNTDKSKRVEFHLRVLIKALLDQMQKMRLKTGIQPEIDEGVIGMIRQQIMDVVNVDDILKVYRVVPKIVEVQKVVNQVVQKIVQVPHYITVENNRFEPVPVRSVEVVKDTVNVPLEVPKVHTLVRQKLVLGNQLNQKVIPTKVIEQIPYQTVKEVPTVRNVQTIVPLPQQVLKTIQIQGPQRVIPLQKPVIHNMIQQKIVPVRQVVQKIVQVEKIVEKIIKVPEQVIKIIEVDRIVEKPVEVIRYNQSKRVQNYVQQNPVEVICYVQKIVPVQRIVERVVTYPQIVQKIVPVVTREQVIKEVQVIKQVPLYEKELIVQDRIIEKPTPPLIHEAIKQIERIVEIPLIQQRVKVETQYIKQPVIQRQQKLVREPVYIQVPVMVLDERVMQIEKPMVQLVRQQYPKQMIRQKIVPIETVRDQLVPTPYIVEKIIEKLVQVPRVVEVEKIVEKIVPIPRIVQKIVEVQKIIQKIVEKNIYHTNIQAVQYLRDVPYQVQKVITIQIPQYILQTKQVPRIVEKEVPVVSEVRTTQVKVQNIQQPPRIVVQRRQMNVNMTQQKVVPIIVQDHVYVELQEQIVVPIQVPVPKTLIQQIIVPVEQIVPKIQPVDRIVQKIVPVVQQRPGRVEQRDRLVQKLVEKTQIRIVRDQIPYYNERMKQVQTMVQKIVPVERVVRQTMQVPFIVQKIVNQIMQVPNIYEVQKVVQVPVKEQQLITIDRIVPKIVTLNKAFAQIVDKLHEFPRLVQQIQQVQRRIDNIAVQRQVNTQIIQKQVIIQKAVLQQRLKQVEKYVNVVNQSLNVVDRIIEKPSEPIIITQQKILQVPVIVQKIAQRIVIMPQIVEVLKYVHQITDNNNLGMAFSEQVGGQQVQYQRLAKNVNNQLGNLRNVIFALKSLPDYKNQINIIERFLSEFNKFIAYPRIRQIMNERIVHNTIQKPRIVQVPTRSSDDQRRNLTNAVLIDKLLMSLKRAKSTNPNIQNAIDPQIIEIFGPLLEPVSKNYGNNYNQLLDQYSRAIYNKFNTYGTFTPDHQRMLKQFIEQRFELANRLKKTNKDSIKYKQLYGITAQNYNREHINNEIIANKFNDLQNFIRMVVLNVVDITIKRTLEQKLYTLNESLNGYKSAADTPTTILVEMSDMDKDRANRYLREKEMLIIELRKTIKFLQNQLQKNKTESPGVIVYGNCNIHSHGEQQNQLEQLRKANSQLKIQINRINIQLKKAYQRIEYLSKNPQGGDRDHTSCKAQINKLNNDLRRTTQDLRRANQQLIRLRQMEKIHSKCAITIQRYEKQIIILKQKIIQLERIIQKLKPKNENNYGKNFMEYVGLGQSRKSQSNQSASSSSSSRQAYRSADNNYDINRYNDMKSTNYNPQQSLNNLTESRQSGNPSDRAFNGIPGNSSGYGSQNLNSPVFNKTNYTGSTGNKNSMRASNNLGANYDANSNLTSNNLINSPNMYKSSTNVNTNQEINPNMVSSTQTRQVTTVEVVRQSQLRSSKSGNKQTYNNNNSRAQVSDGSSSNLYGNSTREIIKRTYRQEPK